MLTDCTNSTGVIGSSHFALEPQTKAEEKGTANSVVLLQQLTQKMISSNICETTENTLAQKVVKPYTNPTVWPRFYDYRLDETILDLVHFLDRSPTAWQAVDNVRYKLLMEGFKQLREDQPWHLEAGGSYFVERNGSASIAFVLPSSKTTHITIIGAHTDSPALKLKPNPDIIVENMHCLSSEIYGGPTLPSWLNRDLTIAGVCYYINNEGKRESLSVNIEETVATIPYLSIHLERDLLSKTNLNLQKDLNAFVGYGLNLKKGESYISKLIEERYGVVPLEGSELFLVPSEPTKLWGPGHKNISSYRLDNLLGSHASLESLIRSKEPSQEGHLKMVALWDNEEVGNITCQGAASRFLKEVLKRIYEVQNLTKEEIIILKQKSLLVSNDVAHAFHPNYPEAFDPNHKLLFGEGVVVKVNACQKYATSSNSQSLFEKPLNENKITTTHFVSRNDKVCGTTLGPTNAVLLGIPTIDIGAGVFSMHASREIGSAEDHINMCHALETLFKERENC